MDGKIQLHERNGQQLSYVCDDRGGSLAKTHRIIVKLKNWSLQRFVLLLLMIGFLLGVVFKSGAGFWWPLPLLGSVLFIRETRKRVAEEVVVVIPTLGVQLQTVYYSKKVHRRFVPLQKIVAPVINEALSPVTCYFYLALILRGDDNLVLTFPGLRPPLKMLVPIWRSLREAVGTSVAEAIPVDEEIRAAALP